MFLKPSYYLLKSSLIVMYTPLVFLKSGVSFLREFNLSTFFLYLFPRLAQDLGVYPRL